MDSILLSDFGLLFDRFQFCLVFFLLVLNLLYSLFYLRDEIFIVDHQNLPLFFHSFLNFFFIALPRNPLKIRNFQNFQFPFTKTFEYEIPFSPSKIPKPLGESKYDFSKNPSFPQKSPGIPKHSRF